MKKESGKTYQVITSQCSVYWVKGTAAELLKRDSKYNNTQIILT